jgi:hypothetical protein
VTLHTTHNFALGQVKQAPFSAQCGARADYEHSDITATMTEVFRMKNDSGILSLIFCVLFSTCLISTV